MTEAQRRVLDHVVLPRRRPGLALLERYFPSPADNVLDAELASFAAPGDTVLDPWAGTGWTARRAVAHGMRAVAAEPSPFALLAARAFLHGPDGAALDAAFAQLASSRRVDVPLRQHIEELYATHCATCERPVIGDQFIWPRDADAPGRKIYRCAACDIAVGGPEDRVAAVDTLDLAKLGIDRPRPPTGLPASDPAEAEDELPPAPVGLTDVPEAGRDELAGLGEGGEPPPPPAQRPEPSIGAAAGGPRWASSVRPEAVPAPPAAEMRRSQQYQQLRQRFPVLDDRDELVDELLDLYTPRNLYALGVIANKIDAEFRDAPAAAVFRLALAACLLPASKLNGYPGRVASLRIANGRVRQPASRHQREMNVWHLFETSYRDVRTAIAALGRDRRQARFATDYDDLGGMSAANLLWIRCRPAVVGQYLPSDAIDFVVGAPYPGGNNDELSFEYLATAWLLGREAAETLRLEPLFGSSSGSNEAESTALRHAIASAAGTLKPGGWFSVLVENPDLERIFAIAVAGAAAELDVVHVIHRESRRAGEAVTLHLRKRSAEDRLREAVQPNALRLGAGPGHLTYPELATAIGGAAVALLRDRGEPAGLLRIASAVVSELARAGLLARVSQMRSGAAGDEASTTSDRAGRGGAALIVNLLHEELARDDHPQLVRLEDGDLVQWWLRQPDVAEAPLADRVEWATYSILSTAGQLTQTTFLDRIYRLFPAGAAPDEELVRACLAAYAQVMEDGTLISEDDLPSRLEGHARMIALLVDIGHRLGLKVWISKREQRRSLGGSELGSLLHDGERRAYLPLIVRAPAEILGEVDVLWYVRGRLAFLFEVEWTAMVGDAVLRRGRQIEPTDQQARFLVFPAERSDLLRLKLERSPWLRGELDSQNWHFLKWQHLEALGARDTLTLESLEPMLGLDPLAERGGEQLTIFGE